MDLNRVEELYEQRANTGPAARLLNHAVDQASGWREPHLPGIEPTRAETKEIRSFAERKAAAENFSAEHYNGGNVGKIAPVTAREVDQQLENAERERKERGDRW